MTDTGDESRPDAGGTDLAQPRPAPGPPPALGRLAGTVGRMPGPVFAVVDGGHFDDLPAALASAGLAARSLFLGHGAQDVERHGPWFVPMRHEGEVGAVLGVVGDLPAVVFWSCGLGDVALYGHLRRLNMARLPVWAAAGKSGPEPGVDADRGWEAVLFRHWDPRVLGALLPVLDAGQFSRVLGPAGEVAFHAEDYGGTKRMVADPDWPAVPTGLLTIRPDQVGALVERRADARRARICSYLREVAPEQVKHLSEGELGKAVLLYEREARGFEVEGDRATALWAYMRLTSKPDLGRETLVRRFLADPSKGGSADQRIDALFDLRTHALRQQDRR